MKDIKQSAQGHQISRREALKLMTIGSLGLAMSGSVLSSCSPKGGKSTSSAGSKAIKMSAPDGTKITTRKWASLGDEIGLLGLGCMRLPQLPAEKQTRRGELDQEKVNELVEYALEHGVNYFDTAPAYGDSERAVGVALSRYERSSYLLATKMSNFAPAVSLEQAKKIFETSLNNLQTSYFDFYLLHAIGDKAGFEQRFVNNGVLDWIKEQKAAGKIRHLGFSYHGSNDFLKELIGLADWDFAQIQMNYVDWKKMEGNDNADAETEYKLLEAAGIPVAVMEPIRGGALANINTKLKDMLAERHPELTPAGVALTFAASFPGIMCTLSGMSNMAQLKENIATFTDFQPFTEEDNNLLFKVAELWSSNPHIPCTGCQYCMPCPNGVNIPGTFAVYNSASDDLALPNPENPDKNFKKNRKEFLKHYNENLADGTRADACTNCFACVSKCPQHLRIPEYLRKIDDFVEKLR